MNCGIELAAQFLKDNDYFCFLCHKNPDGDCLGGAFAIFYALTQLSKKCIVKCSDGFLEKFNFIYPNKMEKFLPKVYVTIDVPDLKLVGAEFSNLPISLCIDHHESNNIKAQYSCVNFKAAATCEIIYSIFKCMDFEINSIVASCLYLGLSTDTGCFRFSNTTALTHRIAADLIDCGADYCNINFKIFEQKKLERLKLEAEIIRNLEFYFSGSFSIVFVTKSMLKKVGGNEDLYDEISAIVRQPCGVKVGLTVKEVGFLKYKVSARAVDGFDVFAYSKRFGGGGHKAAAGFDIEGEVENVRKVLLKEAVEEFCF